MRKIHSKRIKRIFLMFLPALVVGVLSIGCQTETKDNEKTDYAEEKEEVSKECYGDDKGKNPFVLDIEKETLENENYRKAKWTGEYMQMVFMSLKPGEIIDLEVHNNHDQFIRIEQGEAKVIMGKTKDELTFKETIYDDWAAFIPGGYWHKIKNIGDVDLKLYTIYAPPEHAPGTINKTYKEAKEYAHDHDH